jgi:hypothetical protein
VKQPLASSNDRDPTGDRRARRDRGVLVDHDDDEREFAYRFGAETSLQRAPELGWTVVSAKYDWATVFA